MEDNSRKAKDVLPDVHIAWPSSCLCCIAEAAAGLQKPQEVKWDDMPTHVYAC